MISAAGLSTVAALLVGLTGAPIDAFLPLVAAVALHREWPPVARLVLALSLGPLAAQIDGDFVLERTALYAVIGLVATRADGGLEDTVASRVLLVAGCLGVVLGTRALLALGGGPPAPAEGLGEVAANIVWTAVHAGVLATLGRARPWMLGEQGA